MALHEFDCKGFGQIELSQVWFDRAGMIEAQCELDPARFASHFPLLPTEISTNKIVAENGAFLMCDKERKIATVPTKALSDWGYVAGINYSTERNYNQFTPGRRNFCLIRGQELPRIGFVEPGMRICTNSVCWDDTASFFPAGATAAEKADSKYMYDAVKAYLAKVNDSTTGRAGSGTTLAPIYAVLLDDAKYTGGMVNRGKLVIGADPKDAVGGIYAIVTEAYTNADTTLSFKLKFVNKPATN